MNPDHLGLGGKWTQTMVALGSRHRSYSKSRIRERQSLWRHGDQVGPMFKFVCCKAVWKLWKGVTFFICLRLFVSFGGRSELLSISFGNATLKACASWVLLASAFLFSQCMCIPKGLRHGGICTMPQAFWYAHTLEEEKRRSEEQVNELKAMVLRVAAETCWTLICSPVTMGIFDQRSRKPLKPRICPMTRMSSNAKQPRQTAAVLRRWCWASWTSSQWTASDHYFFYFMAFYRAQKKDHVSDCFTPDCARQFGGMLH